MQKVAAYCRVSTDKEDQLNSLEYQTYYFEELAKEREDYELYKIYADRGITATSWNKRVQFKNMLVDAGLDIDMFKNELRLSLSSREPLFNRILVKDVSRFTRNINAMEIIAKLKQKGVYVDFSTANLTTETLEDDVMLGILMLLAEQESKDKSTKVKFGQRRGAEKGVIMTADIFYGYKYRKEENILEIVPEEAEVIRLVYELYIGGYGFRKIINELDSRGIKTRKGKSFVQQSIKRMLTNPAYKGWLVRNKFDSPQVFSGKVTATLRSTSDWIVHKDRIPTIISEETFDNAQTIRQAKINHTTRRGVKSATSKYAGIIFCNKCGSTYTRNREASTNRIFYNCGLKKRKGKTACDAPNLFEDELEAALEKAGNFDLMSDIVSHKKAIIGMLEEAVKKPLMRRLDSGSEDMVRTKQAELLGLTSKKQRLADLYLTGNFDISYLQSVSSQIEEDITKVAQEIEDLSKDNDTIMREVREVDAAISEIEAFDFDATEFKESLQLVKSIVVCEGERMVGNHPKPELIINFKLTDIIKRHVSGLGDGKYKDFMKPLEGFNAGGTYKT